VYNGENNPRVYNGRITHGRYTLVGITVFNLPGVGKTSLKLSFKLPRVVKPP